MQSERRGSSVMGGQRVERLLVVSSCSHVSVLSTKLAEPLHESPNLSGLTFLICKWNNIPKSL